GVAVGRDHARADPGGVGPARERRDDVVRLPALELDVAVAERLDDRPEVRELLAQEIGHRPAVGLVLLGELDPVDRPGVPGDGAALRPVVGEQLEEDVREAEQRVGREAVARRELLGEGEERSIGEVVAVDEEEIALASGRVVDLQLGSGQRLRHSPTLSCAGRDPGSSRRRSRHGFRAARRAPRAAMRRGAAAARGARLPRRGRGALGPGSRRRVRRRRLLRGADPRRGPNVWIEAAGHAARDSELVRDLYAEAARGWVERGLRVHYVLVPATDAGLVDAWFRLGFGAQQAHGVVEIPEVGWPTEARLATLDDLEQMVALAPLLDEHSRASPVFATPSAYSEDDLRAEIAGDLANEDYGNIVAERDGRLVGDFFVCPIELSDAHAGLARPPGAAILGFAVIRPDLRGTGIGLALTQACFAWARERGYRTMVTDWRVTNLSASRFWPRRGFRTTFLRLHRHVA